MIKLIGEKLRQYDLNRTVELIPKHGYTVKSVCFSKGLEPLTVAHREENGTIVASIPNCLLKGFGSLLVKVRLSDKDGFYTNERQTFWIDNREMPEGYVYEETPILTLGTGGVSSWNDLTDKPFGTEKKETALLEETSLPFEEGQGATSMPLLVAGESYTVMWDGTKYECVCQDVGDGAFVVGNLGAMEPSFENTGEPFIIMSFDNGDGAMALMVDAIGSGATTHTVGVTGIVEIVTKLPEIYLDQSVPFFDLVEMGVPTVMVGKGVNVDMDFSGVVEAANKGKPVDFRLNVGGTKESGSFVEFRAVLSGHHGGATGQVLVKGMVSIFVLKFTFGSTYATIDAYEVNMA